jgi:hypothetical protein
MRLKKKKRLAHIKRGPAAKNLFNKWLFPAGKQRANARFFISPLMKVSNCPHDFGECLIGASTKSKSGFKCTFLNAKGSDAYVHHVAVLANSESVEPIHTIKVLKKVSAKKKEKGALSISHLCGNGGCARPGHLLIEDKYINDERVACHRFLRRCKTHDQCAFIRELCWHEPKCFINVYVGIKDYY